MMSLAKNGFKYVELAPATIVLGIFIFFSSLSIFYTVNHHEAVEHVSYWFCFFVLVFLINATVRENKKIIYILRTLFVTSLISIAYSIWINHGIDLSSLRTAYIGTFGHPTFFAEYLIPVIPVGFTLFMVEKDKFYKVIFFLGSFFVVFYTLLTKTRASWIALTLCTIFAVLFNRRKINRLFTKKRIIVFIIVLLVIIFIGYLFMPHQFKIKTTEGIIKIINPEHGRYEIFRHQTILMRAVVWKNTVRMFLKHPLIGVGMGHFRIFYPRFRGAEDFSVYPRGIRFAKVHNEFLQIFVEGGIIGGILFIGFIGLLIWGAYTLIKREEEREVRIIYSGLLISLVAMLANALFSSNLRIPSSSLVFWVIAGLLGTLQVRKGFCVKIPSYIFLIIVPCLAFFLVVGIKTLFASYEYKTGTNYIKMKHPSKAIERFERSLEWLPYKSRRWFELGKLYQELNVTDKALNAYEQGLVYDPFNVFFLNNLGAIYYQLGDLNKAEESFKKIIEIDPSYIGAYYNLYATYKALGDESLEEEMARRIEEVDPLFYAKRLVNEKKWQDARDKLDQALYEHEGKAEVHKMLAITLFELGEYEEAIERIDRAIQIDKLDWELNYLRGYYSFKKGDYELMSEHYKRALDKLVYEREKHFELIEYYSDQGFFSYVVKETEMLDTLREREFDMRSQICIYEAGEDRIGMLNNEFDDLLKIGVYNFDVYREIIDTLYRHNRYESVKDYLERITKGGEHKEKWEGLLRNVIQILALERSAQRAEERGDVEGAKGYYEKIIELNEHDIKASGNLSRLRQLK